MVKILEFLSDGVAVNFNDVKIIRPLRNLNDSNYKIDIVFNDGSNAQCPKEYTNENDCKRAIDFIVRRFAIGDSLVVVRADGSPEEMEVYFANT